MQTKKTENAVETYNNVEKRAEKREKRLRFTERMGGRKMTPEIRCRFFFFNLSESYRLLRVRGKEKEREREKRRERERQKREKRERERKRKRERKIVVRLWTGIKIRGYFFV